MSSLSIEAGSEYLFSRLHGIWSTRYHGESLQSLVRLDDENQFFRAVGERGISCADRIGFHRELKLREMSVFDELMRMSSGSLSGYYSAFMRQPFYSNVKVLLHFRVFEGNKSEIMSLLDSSPAVRLPDLDAIEHVESVEAFLRCLGAGAVPGGLGSCIRRYQKDHDMQLFETSLDGLYYDELHAAASGLPPSLRSCALELLGEEIDIVNVGMMLRNVRTYHFTRERLGELLLKHGRHMGVELLSELGVSGDAGRAMSGLPHVWRMSSEGDVSVSRLLHGGWCRLYRHALREFSRMDDLSLPLVAFPYLQRIETLNLVRIQECLHFRLPQREIQELLID